MSILEKKNLAVKRLKTNCICSELSSFIYNDLILLNSNKHIHYSDAVDI